jgi:biopolymer transport protein ExbD
VQLRGRRRREVRIDLSALIDAVFLLLIFFAVSTTFLDTSGLQLELPRAETGTPQERGQLTVWIRADGRVRFGDRDVAMEDLEPRLREALGASPDRFVVLQADRRTPLEAVVAVMDAARKAGARGVTLASRPE